MNIINKEIKNYLLVHISIHFLFFFSNRKSYIKYRNSLTKVWEIPYIFENTFKNFKT